MPAIRILIVDDSSVIRRVLADALARDSAIEVVGSAADGTIALSKISLLKPDLVTLDIEMPGMSGLETVAAIRKLHPHLPVIMFSTLTERGATSTLEALSLGASDYVTKPSNTGSLEETRSRIQQELIPKVKALCKCRDLVTQPLSAPLVVSRAHRSGIDIRQSRAGRVDVVAIGTSTGGPNALAALLPSLPMDLPVPVVIVQHMPPLFTRLLAERLNKISRIAVREGEEGALLTPGTAWIAPGDFHMTLRRDPNGVRLAMNRQPAENSCRPAVDVLFRSVAEAYGANSLAVILTGMGSDGQRGSQSIREAGGQVLVQDEPTSVVWGMPGQVVAAGLSDAILSLDAIPKEISRRTELKRVWSGTAHSDLARAADDQEQARAIEKLALFRRTTS